MDSDYIGSIQNARWNTQASGWLMRTPSWMEGGFKTGPRVSNRQFSSGGGGRSALNLDWSRTDTTAGGIKFATRVQNRPTKQVSQEEQAQRNERGQRLGEAINARFGGSSGAPTP